METTTETVSEIAVNQAGYASVKKTPEYVTPVERDGIKFYVSSDGTKTGLSQSGIGKLVDISESSIRSLLAAIANPQNKRTVSLPDSLAYFAESEVFLPLTGKQQERVVRADVAAAIIEYYAFESTAKTETALYSYRQFARKGLEAWIKEIVGYKDDINTIKISPEAGTNEVLMTLVSEIREMKAQLELTSGFRKAAPSMPGLVTLTDGYRPDTDKGIAYSKAEPNELYTQNEWIELSGYKPLNRVDKHMLALNISGLYSSMFMSPPEKVSRRGESGALLSPVAAYPREHFSILQTAYTQMMASKQQKKAAAEAKKLAEATRIVIGSLK